MVSYIPYCSGMGLLYCLSSGFEPISREMVVVLVDNSFVRHSFERGMAEEWQGVGRYVASVGDEYFCIGNPFWHWSIVMIIVVLIK